MGGNVSALALSTWEVAATYHANRPSLGGVSWRQLDVADAGSVKSLVSAFRPDVIIHAAALADIDACEKNPKLAWEINVRGTRNVVASASAVSARLIHLSTSTVFDGKKGDYEESDPTQAINVYARTKIASEAEALSNPGNLVVRTTLVLGFPKPAGRSFLADAVSTLQSGRSLALPRNEIRNPIDVWTLSSCLLELAASCHSGILHVAGIEKVSRFEMGLKIAEKLGSNPALVFPMDKPPPGRAPRPKDASLDTRKARSLLKTSLPDCAQAINRAFAWAEEIPQCGDGRFTGGWRRQRSHR